MLVIMGLCKGHFAKNKTVRGANGEQTITEHSILLEVTEQSRYGMEETKIKEVRLSKNHMSLGMEKLYDQLKEKQVSVPVFVQTWASKSNNSGHDLWLSGEGRPLNLQLVKSVAAAS